MNSLQTQQLVTPRSSWHQGDQLPAAAGRTSASPSCYWPCRRIIEAADQRIYIYKEYKATSPRLYTRAF